MRRTFFLEIHYSDIGSRSIQIHERVLDRSLEVNMAKESLKGAQLRASAATVSDRGLDLRSASSPHIGLSSCFYRQHIFEIAIKTATKRYYYVLALSSYDPIVCATPGHLQNAYATGLSFR